MAETFDAAKQQEFKNLGDVDWITINGNHVPIPKNATKKQKAEAIKEFFAAKKSQGGSTKSAELPKAKGPISYYGARIQHASPLLSASGSGEGANVHGYGQYTARSKEIVRKRYFDRFSKPSYSYKGDYAELSTNQKKVINFMEHYGYNIKETRRHYGNVAATLDTEMENLQKDIDFYTKEIEQKRADYNYEMVGGNISNARDRIEYDKERLAEKQKKYDETQEKIAYIESLTESDFIKAPANIMVDGKLITDPGISFALWKIKTNDLTIDKQIEREQEKLDAQMALPKYKRKPSIVNQQNKTIKYLEDLKKSGKEIKYAQPQLTTVRLPASKYYLREYQPLAKQPKYVREQMPAVAREYIERKYKVSEKALKDAGIYDDFNIYVRGLVGLEKGEVRDKALSRIKRNVDAIENYRKSTLPGFSYQDRPDFDGPEYYYAIKSVGENFDGNTSGASFYRNLGSDNWYSSTQQGKRNATAILKNAGIAGIKYKGELDGDCNVSFDPKDIEVINRETKEITKNAD